MTDQLPEQPAENEIVKKATKHRKPVFDPTGRIEGLMPGEELVFDLRRHPIGLFFIYLQIVVAITLAVGITILFLPSIGDVFGVADSVLTSLAAALALFMVAFGVLFLIIATRIYEGNQVIASDKNITMVAQISLFNRKISELSMANIEDVSARQNGILPTMFNYGSLHIETAGEQDNFIFTYCPNPNAYAKAILDCRTSFITSHGH